MFRDAVAACFLAALIGVLAWALILLAYRYPAGLLVVVGAVLVGAGWAAIAHRRRNQ